MKEKLKQVSEMLMKDGIKASFSCSYFNGGADVLCKFEYAGDAGFASHSFLDSDSVEFIYEVFKQVQTK